MKFSSYPLLVVWLAVQFCCSSASSFTGRTLTERFNDLEAQEESDIRAQGANVPLLQEQEQERALPVPGPFIQIEMPNGKIAYAHHFFGVQVMSQISFLVAFMAVSLPFFFPLPQEDVIAYCFMFVTMHFGFFAATYSSYCLDGIGMPCESANRIQIHPSGVKFVSYWRFTRAQMVYTTCYWSVYFLVMWVNPGPVREQVIEILMTAVIGGNVAALIGPILFFQNCRD